MVKLIVVIVTPTISRKVGGVLTSSSIGRNVTNDGINYCGGTSTSTGAYLTVMGKDAGGYFNIVANDGTYTQNLVGYTSGTLAWSGLSFARTVNNSELQLCGGTNYASGASVILYGKDATSLNGMFRIRAAISGSECIDLCGWPDGTLSWGTKHLAMQEDVNALLNGKANSSHTHTKNQITDFPTIPSNTSQLTNDSGYITSSGSCNYANSAGGVAWDNVSGKPSAFTPYFANGTWYAVGDDAAIGDHNVGGGLGVKALNSTTTRIDLCYSNDASNYKSIMYDGTTLYMNGNCDYATSAGSCNYANSAGSSSIAIRDSGGTWISGRDNAVVKQTRHSTEDGNSWNPAVSIKTKNGNWTIGTVGYDKLQFSYDRISISQLCN